jgi:hypothetical protein
MIANGNRIGIPNPNIIVVKPILFPFAIIGLAYLYVTEKALLYYGYR